MTDEFRMKERQFGKLMDWFKELTGQEFNQLQMEELYEYLKFISYDDAEAYMKALILAHPKKTYTISDLYQPIASVIARVKDTAWKDEFEKRRAQKRLCAWCNSTGILEAVQRNPEDRRHLSVFLAIDKPTTKIFKCPKCNIAKEYRKLSPNMPFFSTSEFPQLTPIPYSAFKASTVDKYVKWDEIKKIYYDKKTNAVMERGNFEQAVIT